MLLTFCFPVIWKLDPIDVRTFLSFIWLQSTCVIVFVVGIFFFRKGWRILHSSYSSPGAAAPRAPPTNLWCTVFVFLVIVRLFINLPFFLLLLFWDNSGLELVKKWHRTLSMSWCLLQTLSLFLRCYVL